jgi:high-affinity Fe2+/Pb2+ permease
VSTTFFCYIRNPTKHINMTWLGSLSAHAIPLIFRQGLVGSLPTFVWEGALIIGSVVAFLIVILLLLYWGGRVYRSRMKAITRRLLQHFNDRADQKSRQAGLDESSDKSIRDVLIKMDDIEVLFCHRQ